MTEREVEIVINKVLDKTNRRQQPVILNIIYAITAPLLVIAIGFIFSFIMDLNSINQRQDRDIKEIIKTNQTKYKSIDYNFKLLNNGKYYLYEITDNKTQTK